MNCAHKDVSFEVQNVQQIWRREYCTFNVSYPTKQLVCVFALRGRFTSYDYKALNNIFYSMGFKSVMFERDVDGVLVEQIRTLRKPFPNIEATTFERDR